MEAISNRPERFAAGSVLFAGERPLVVLRAGPHGGPAPAGQLRSRWIIAFDGLVTRNQAEQLRDTVLSGDPWPDDDNPDALWIHELVGAEVVDMAGADLGRVVAVEANPASDLLVLDGGALVPLVFVVESGSGRVVVDPPAGLLEL